ncbi:hypothetical protein I4J24_05550, partial [Corynebacterium diphtheriae bv. mitis]|nr:hypothetical protein [Corynebacterium diphtheriae bv. mitis]
ATPVAQTTTEPSDNVLANRYKAYRGSEAEAKSATPVAQTTTDTVSHNSSSDTSEN